MELDENPNNWEMNYFTIDHVSGTRIWVKSGWMFCEPYPSEGFSLFQKFKLWRKIQKIRRQQSLLALSKTIEEAPPNDS